MTNQAARQEIERLSRSLDLEGLQRLGTSLYEDNHLELAALAFQACVKLFRPLESQAGEQILPLLVLCLIRLFSVQARLANLAPPNERSHSEGKTATVEARLSRLKSALECAKKLLLIFRELAKQKPEVYWPHLATTLNNLGTVHNALNAPEAARTSFEEGLTIYRELARQQPEFYQPTMATTLNNLATVQRNLSDLESARANFEEALEIRRELVRQRPEVYWPQVASTLNSLGTVQCDLNALEAAQSSYEDALAIWRELARQWPEIYRSEVAMTLNNLGTVQCALNALETAQSSYEETLAIWRELARQWPDIYRSEVAMTLNNLGIAQCALNALEAAQASFEEGLTIYRDLARQQPEVYRPYVATTLNNIGNVQHDLNILEAAQASYEEALTIRRELAQQRPEVYWPEVAGSLSNLGNVQRNLSDLEAARASHEEALAIWRELARQRPEVYRSDVARTLNNLGTVLHDLNAMEGARASYEEALAIRRELARQRPEVYRSDVAMTLNNLGRVQSDLNALEAARASYEEALAIRRELAWQWPAVYRRDVATSLGSLGTVQRYLNALETARASFEEGLTIFRELAQRQPEVYKPDVAGTLNNLGNVQRDLNDLESARVCFEEANDLYDADATRNPFARLIARMRCRDNLGRLLLRESSAPDKPDYALACEKFRQARDIFEQFRARFVNPGERKRVMREAAGIYERLLQTCVDLWDVEGGGLHHLQEAVEVAEASRSRHLIDLLAHEVLDPRFAPAHLVDAFRELRRRLRQIERRLMEGDSSGSSGAFGSEAGLKRASTDAKMVRLTMQRPEALATASPSHRNAEGARLVKLLAERDELNRQHAALLAQIRQHNPEFDPEQPVTPVSFAQAQALLPTDTPTAIVQFTLTHEHGLALVIIGNDILKVPLPDCAERQGWELANEWLRNYYEGRDRDIAAWMRRWEQALPGLLRGVAVKVLQPVVDRIQGLGLRRFVLVPHRALHIFPLHACPLADGSFATDYFEIVYAPSLSLLHRCAERPRSDRETLLLVQNPTGDLLYSEVEGRAIQQIYGSSCQALEHEHATKERVFEFDETAHVKHYTGHSYFHPKEPLKSALKLESLSEHTSSRWLQLGDAFTQLDLRRNRLTILNGCESGMLLPDPVDEYVNLPTGFLYAGAACVISTLWPVWDLSSALLMVRFHQIWKEDGRSDRIAAALRQAQNWLRREISSGPHLRDEVLPAFLESVEDEVLREKCIAAADDYARRFPNRPPFAHPIYWAPFVCSGLGYPPSS